LAMAGEPWQTFFDPSALVADLLKLGFGQVEQLGPEEMNVRYFADRKDNLSVSGFCRFIKAII
jgi:hypothetical protein